MLLRTQAVVIFFFLTIFFFLYTSGFALWMVLLVFMSVAIIRSRLEFVKSFLVQG